MDFSIEQLVELDLSSITKSLGSRKQLPAAFYVVSSEDIRRLGATTIPEALRLVPGVHVAKIDGGRWSVSVRGFNSQLAETLLVLVDGRSVYTPLLSSTFWDQLDVMMEDIERIEVMRGPGASLWGSNAVNGVINIVTKSARSTQGGLASAFYGNERYGGGMRYGFEAGEDAHVSVFARHAQHDDSKARFSSVDAGDAAQMSKFGFRYDKDFFGNADLSVQGAAFTGESNGANQIFPHIITPQVPSVQPPYNIQLPTGDEFSGHYLMARWQQRQSADSTTALRIYWDRHNRRSPALDVSYQVDSIDLDFQHNYRLNPLHYWVWGAGVRFNHNNYQPSLYVALSPEKRTDRIYSLFAQDEISLLPNTLKLTLGSKFEHNPVTQFEIQPNIGLSWSPDEIHTVWGSIARAVRTPNWIEQNVQFQGYLAPPPDPAQPVSPANPVTLISINGNPRMTTEKLLAFQLGWRADWQRTFDTDLSLYYYNYDDVRSYNSGGLQTDTLFSGYVVLPIKIQNYGFSKIYGGELSANWQVSNAWRLRASYSYSREEIGLSSTSPSVAYVTSAGNYPVNNASVWSQLQLTSDWSFDLNWRFVGGKSNNVFSYNTLPTQSYHELDARLAWQLNKDVEFALIGRNLLESVHFEANSHYQSIATGVQRQVYFSVKWQF
ncbi:TonB-dependent receptor plug domain-containing protein [Methylomonas sp. HYX-M1]|uniref:TonB-dependent receptor plug domain-containing protein n=1 Tax=Methylomonas sp. HYX-M1 TaxID=3139307 RepID=UPI00345BF30C